MVNSVGATASFAPAVAGFALRQSETDGPRPQRADPAIGDLVQLSSPSQTDVLQQRDRLDAAQGRIGVSLAAAREALGVLGQISELAQRGADPAIPAEARALQQGAFEGFLSRLEQIVARADEASGGLVTGVSVRVEVQTAGLSIEIEGVDLRLQAAPDGDAALQLSLNDHVRDQSGAKKTARAVELSIANVSAALVRLDEGAERLARHDNVLGALDAALSAQVAQDLDADGARLLALQVRQSLAGTNVHISQHAPKALLALFREVG
jgi:flagellin